MSLSYKDNNPMSPNHQLKNTKRVLSNRKEDETLDSTMINREQREFIEKVSKTTPVPINIVKASS
jgi:hypothetical protein